MKRAGLWLGSALALLSPSTARAACELWSESRCDATNGASIEIDAPQSRAPHAWSFDGSRRVWGYEPGMTTWSSPSAGRVAGRAMVAVGSYDRNVYAVDAASGERLWTFTTGGPVFATPVFWEADGMTRLYVTSSDRIVYALDAALGRQLWVHAVESYQPTQGGARVASAALGRVGDTDFVFVPFWVWDSSLAHNEQHAAVIALTAREGRPAWRRDLGDNQLTDAVFASIGARRLLLLGSNNGNVYALDATDGRVLWQHTELDAMRSPPAVVDTVRGTLVITASKYGSVRALSAETGRELWQFKTGDRITGSPAALGQGRRSRVFVGSYDRHVYALDAATGELVFRYAARGGVYSSPALVPGASRPVLLVSAWDHLLHTVGLSDGKLEFVTYTGRPLWNVAGIDESNWSSPIAARINGRWMAYAGSYDGTLRALPLEEEDRLAPALRSNLWFWLSFPIALTPLFFVASWLTRRWRRAVATNQS